MAQNVDEISRNFSNAVIMWKISNISLAMCPPLMVVNGPEFTLSGPIATQWRLSLHISHQRDTIVVYLELLGPDPKENNLNPEKTILKVNCFANFLDSNGEEPLEFERELRFNIHDMLPVRNFELSETFRILPQMGPDDLNVRCYMLVDFEVEPDLPTAAPDGLIALSNALSKLPEIVLFPDCVIVTGSNLFRLHQDMLVYRGHGLSRLIEQHGNSQMIKILNYDGISVGALFRYIYSGNLNHILFSPRITICDHIERLGIPELQDAYSKEKIKVESNVEGLEFVFKWKIENFEDILDPLSCPELYKGGIESCWQLCLYPKGPMDGNEQKKNFVFFEASLLESSQILDVCLEFTCVNEQDEIIYSRRVQERMKAGDKRQLEYFFRGGTRMKKCLIKKDILLRFTVRIATGLVIPATVEIRPPLPFSFDNNKSLIYFSSKMKFILQNPRKYDIILSNEKDKVRAHRFLLAARSLVFKKKLTDFGSGGTLSVPKIKRHYLRIFVEYLYTGFLNDFEVSAIYELYDLGRMFQVDDLVSVCTANFEVTPENVLEVLTYADENNLSTLKTEAIQLIGVMGDGIIDHPGWTTFASNKNELSNDVLNFVRKVFEDIPEE